MTKLSVPILALLFSTLSLPSAAATLWGIYWLSSPVHCSDRLGTGDGLGGPIISSYYPPCTVRETKVSICPGMRENGSPWEQDAAITVVGYEVTLMLSSPTSQGIMEVGSGHGGDGADVFATTAGIGTSSRTGFFPAGTGLPQGGMPAYSHFDIYADCDGGSSQSMQALVNIYYTSP